MKEVINYYHEEGLKAKYQKIKQLNKLIMKIIKHLHVSVTLIGLIVLLFSACEKSDTEVNKIPAGLKNISVKNIPGGSIISYDAPTDGSAVLVTAVYPTDEGGEAILRFDLAKYANELTLDGLLTDKRKVELYTVSPFGIHSESVEVEIEPLVSPSVLYLNDILETINVEPTPRGLFISSFQNPEQKSLSFIFSVKNEAEEWIEYEIFQSQEISDSFALNDYPSSEFLLQIEDNDGGHKSIRREYLIKNRSEEVLLDKAKWSNAKLPGDAWQSTAGNEIENLWDNITTPGSPRFQGPRVPIADLVFTIDLGENQNLRLSKMLFHQYMRENSLYNQFTPKLFDVWGSNNPAPDGSWEGWTKIKECESYKPSEHSEDATPEDDFAYAEAGETFYFPVDTESYRYFRFQTKSVWIAYLTTSLRLSEITLWGWSNNNQD